jgi:hypothetical protein
MMWRAAFLLKNSDVWLIAVVSLGKKSIIQMRIGPWILENINIKSKRPRYYIVLVQY